MPDVMKVGVVRYLNAKPLYYRLAEFAPGIRLVMDVPSRLADLLAEGSLDLALIPSIEYFRAAGDRPAGRYEILPGFAIAAHGPVRSVKLYCRVAPHLIKRLALDAGSRTSQALTRIWLNAAHGVENPVIESLPLGVPVQESTADAVLLIGDRAMTNPPGQFVQVVDLGHAWRQLTGLPFVFALWVTRAGTNLSDLPDALARSRREGLLAAPAIAAKYGPGLGLDPASCVDYLTRVLSYELGESELAGLRRFAHMASALGLVPEEVDLVFHDRRLDLASRP